VVGRKIDLLHTSDGSEVKPPELNQLGLACLYNIKPINMHEETANEY